MSTLQSWGLRPWFELTIDPDHGSCSKRLLAAAPESAIGYAGFAQELKVAGRGIMLCAVFVYQDDLVLLLGSRACSRFSPGLTVEHQRGTFSFELAHLPAALPALAKRYRQELVAERSARAVAAQPDRVDVPGERGPAVSTSMSYQLTITPKGTYLHAVVTGRNSKENVMRYLEDIRRECAARPCYRVLIEERLDGPRLGMMDVFQIAAVGSSRAQGKFAAIAHGDVNAKSDLMQFAETAAVNRSLPVKVFASVSDAERWLLHQDA